MSRAGLKRDWRALASALVLPWFLAGSLSVIGCAMVGLMQAAEVVAVIWISPLVGLAGVLCRESFKEALRIWRATDAENADPPNGDRSYPAAKR